MDREPLLMSYRSGGPDTLKQTTWRPQEERAQTSSLTSVGSNRLARISVSPRQIGRQGESGSPTSVATTWQILGQGTTCRRPSGKQRWATAAPPLVFQLPGPHIATSDGWSDGGVWPGRCRGGSVFEAASRLTQITATSGEQFSIIAALERLRDDELRMFLIFKLLAGKVM